MNPTDMPAFATIPASLDAADPTGFAPGEMPVNDDTAASPEMAARIRAHLLDRHNRTRLLSAQENA